MGYTSHITRRREGAEDDGDVIEPAEWLALVARIGGFQSIEQVTIGSAVLPYPKEWHSQRWMEHPEFPGAGPIFSLRDGDLTFSGSDMATLHMAFEIADLLNARVVGEEGEEDDRESLLGLRPDGESDWNAKNPFTKEPIYQDQEGVLEKRGKEWHLVTSKRARLRRTEERALLYWVASFPGNAPGSTLRLRGRVSEPGKYGSDRSCKYVFYVFKVIGGTGRD